MGLRLVLHTCSNEGNQDNDLTILLWFWLIVNKWNSQEEKKTPIFRFSPKMGYGVQATVTGIARLIFYSCFLRWSWLSCYFYVLYRFRFLEVFLNVGLT